MALRLDYSADRRPKGVDQDLFERFLIPPEYRDFIRRSWDRDEHTIYGRFDLAFDGNLEPKLLEYNADTPTALLEAAVVQWFWLQDCFPAEQQFNSIHERLLEVFKLLRAETSERFYAFGPHFVRAECRWFEPPWKALLSNKAILPILWEMYPHNPYLLETSPAPLARGDYVKKPILGREGANIQIFEHGKLSFETEGPYEGPAVYQELWPLPRFEQKYFALIGSWIVNGWACGIGVREDESLITGNLSRFVPHVYR